jgi:hypothetical protein
MKNAEIDWSKAPEGATHLIERPQTWNGEGRPPVGTVCLTEHEGEEFSVEILAYGKHGYDDAVLVARRIGNRPGVMHGWIANQCDFRPIRTAEQLTAEERNTAIDKMLDIFESTACKQVYDMRGGIAAIYDAGLRFPAEPDK